MIADGRLLDLIRRVYTFGMCLMKLDLRQVGTGGAACGSWIGCRFPGAWRVHVIVGLRARVHSEAGRRSSRCVEEGVGHGIDVG